MRGNWDCRLNNRQRSLDGSSNHQSVHAWYDVVLILLCDFICRWFHAHMRCHCKTYRELVSYKWKHSLKHSIIIRSTGRMLMNVHQMLFQCSAKWKSQLLSSTTHLLLYWIFPCHCEALYLQSDPSISSSNLLLLEGTARIVSIIRYYNTSLWT